MPYQVIEPLINPADITPLGLGLSSFTPIYLTTDQAFENLKTLLLTKKGERYHQPTFGTRLLYVLFEPNTELIKETTPKSFIKTYEDTVRLGGRSYKKNKNTKKRVNKKKNKTSKRKVKKNRRMTKKRKLSKTKKN